MNLNIDLASLFRQISDDEYRSFIDSFNKVERYLSYKQENESKFNAKIAQEIMTYQKEVKINLIITLPKELAKIIIDYLPFNDPKSDKPISVLKFFDK